jgi:hypothetical protein
MSAAMRAGDERVVKGLQKDGWQKNVLGATPSPLNGPQRGEGQGEG